MAGWLVDPAALGPFFIAVALVELTPGPNMGYLAALAASEGRAAGLRAVAGVTLGLAAYLLASVIGLAEVIGASPMIFGALRWAGVLFLFYLAFEAWRASGESSPAHIDGSRSARAPFWRGMIANLLNPKAALFYVALLPGFASPDYGPFWRQALVFGIVHLAVSVVVHCAIVLGAARAGALLAAADRGVVLRRALAVAIALIAIWLAWETR
jgi:threonine/homoserine/homoserine lactone efflux protein